MAIIMTREMTTTHILLGTTVNGLLHLLIVTINTEDLGTITIEHIISIIITMPDINPIEEKT